MPYCAYCGTEVAPGIAACPHCGHPQHAAAAQPHAYIDPAMQTTDGMAIASLVTALIGCVPAGLILGIIALRRIKKDPAKKGEGLAIGGVVLSSASLLAMPVLVAIAIPTFLGARARAQDRAAEASLRESLSSYDSFVRGEGDPTTIGTDLTFQPDGESTGPTVVSFILERPTLRLAVRSGSGKCLAARHDGGANVAFALQEEAISCRASMFDAAAFVFPALPLGRT